MLWDILPLALILIVLAAGVWRLFAPLYSEGHLVVVITVDSKEYCQVDLSDVESPYELIVPVGDKEVVVHITPESACINESPCPDKLCVNTGKLTKSGQSAVCLPMRVSVSLVTQDTSPDNTPDAVVG